jgi:serine/threonine-protein kinase RsbW
MENKHHSDRCDDRQTLHRLTIAGDTSQLANMRQWLVSTIRCRCEFAASERLISDVELALQEAVVNVMAHAWEAGVQRPINLALSCDRATLRLDISYQGIAFEESAVPPPILDGSSDHGFGLFIMKQLMDEVRHGQHQDGQCFIRLEKKLNEQLER